MTIRRDSLLVSSVLFTIALLCLIPAFWANILTARDKIWLAKLDAGYRAAAGTMSDLSVACLAVILIGLIVTWTGYIRRERWTWFAMFTLVWVWAFPLLALPWFKAIFEGRMVLTLSEWFYSAIYYRGFPRSAAELALIFLLMLIALLLPVRSLFLVSEIQGPSRRLSPRLIGFSVIGVLGTMIALFAWMRVGVLYELPLTELNSARQLPAPPPPPGPYKAQ